MSVFHYHKDNDGIVTVTMDMTGPVNAMNEEFELAIVSVLQRLQNEPDLAGVVITSSKKVFLAGGDLNALFAVNSENIASFMAYNENVKDQMRGLEKLPVPVVAAINGAALGGGLELCLACNYRIAYNDKSVQLGLPEVTLGLLPGGGGIVRMVNLLGLEAALPYLLEGKRVDPKTALEAGIINEIVASPEDLIPAAKSYILGKKSAQPSAVQPWDTKGHRIPGGAANHPKVAQVISLAIPMLRKKTRGLLPAPETVLDCAVQAARLDFDKALKVETRNLMSLVVTPVCKNLITSFFQGNKIRGGANRPQEVKKSLIKQVAVLGAGLMGQDIAYTAARSGIRVILNDLTLELANKGKAHSETRLARLVAMGQIDEAAKQAVLDLIVPTCSDSDLQGSDLIIETVFEDIALKKSITASKQKYLSEQGIWCSNTASLPINRLAEASAKPENFVGLHFFAPAEKMPLVEIICGEKTSDQTIALVYDFVCQIRKTPIIVNGSRGFFASRIFCTYLDEGIRLLEEGVNPVLIENLGKAIGMPVGPLAVHDEISLELTKNTLQIWQETGLQDAFGDFSKTRQVVNTMIDEYGRTGRYPGGGFYQYHEEGSKNIWPPLFDIYHKPDLKINDQDIKDRLLFRQVIETLKCLEEGVLRSVGEGNVGSIMGIGAPVWTGGFIQFVNTFGLERFIQRCDELANVHGERFRAPDIAIKQCATNALFA